MPLIGASGAIAGVVAAYLVLYPRVKVWVLAFARIPLRIPAFIPLILWIGFQVVMFAAGGEDQISWACHIGGIIAGAVLVLVMRSRGVPLLAGDDGEPASRADQAARCCRAGRQPIAAAHATGDALGPWRRFQSELNRFECLPLPWHIDVLRCRNYGGRHR